jgi:hypothetical protein
MFKSLEHVEVGAPYENLYCGYWFARFVGGAAWCGWLWMWSRLVSCDAMSGGGVGAGVGAVMVAWVNAMCKVMEGMQQMKACKRMTWKGWD